MAAKQAGVVSDQQAITTLKRSLKTKVLVDDNSTIAIGGLIQDQQVENVTKVPCLGDIPVLGWFFKSRSEEVRKTNLIVFIRPSIIASQEDLEKLSRRVGDKYERTRQLRTDTEGALREDFGLPPAEERGPAAEEESGYGEEESGEARQEERQ